MQVLGSKWGECRLLSLFFPDMCVGCGHFSDHLVCKACYKTLVYNQAEISRSDQPFTLSLMPYDGVLKAILHHLKFHHNSRLLPIINRRVSCGFKAFIKEHQIDIVIPVPLSKKRLAVRGFNQAKSIFNGVSLVPFLDICRQVDTKPLFELDYAERQQELQGCFSVSQSVSASIQGKRVCIIDDIVTTGTTLAEISRQLYSSEADSVVAFTVAYAVE